MDLRFAICDLQFEPRAQTPPGNLASPCGVLRDGRYAGAPAIASNRKSQIANRKFPKGFSFTEILFAVMILGIGFIMVAAMFPVAIHQTEASNRETIAASIGRAGNSFLNSVATSVVAWPTPPTVAATSTPVWSSVLLPTVIPNPYPRTALAIPSGQSSVTQFGQVWTFNDSRDTYGIVGLGAPGQSFAAMTSAAHPSYLWTLIAKNMIQTTDERFAWVAMYKRDLIAQGAPSTSQIPVPAPYAQIILVGVESRVKPAYDPVNDITYATSPLVAQLIPPTATTPASGNVAISALNVTTGIATITFPGGAPTAAENAFVIVSDDGLTGPLGSTTAPGTYNGRIYRLGVNVSANTWNLAPGEGPGPSDPPLANATVLLVGRGPDPNNRGNYGGLAQDVSVYTTFVQTP